MKKKIFVILLLAIFMLAQFGAVSAAQVAGDTALAPLDTFHNMIDPVVLDWSVTGMPIEGTQYIYIWMRNQGDAWIADPNYCHLAYTAVNMDSVNGTHPFNINFFPINDQFVLEFLVTVSDQSTCANALANDSMGAMAAQASTFIDARDPRFFIANPPSLQTGVGFDNLSVACNTFEMWGIAADNAKLDPTEGYSGFEGWHPAVTGTFAPPAPLGPTYDLLSWVYTLPATASGNWSFSVQPSDFVNNQYPIPAFFRDQQPIDNGSTWSDELADCVDYPDTAGTDTEVYTRYMSQLDLGHGYLDGTFRPNDTLTRAEMAAFIELANGYTGGTLPSGPSSAACTFSDVSVSDWFAGWVWQACDDGFMAGIGGGLFDPNNTLTRGQVVTVLDNITKMLTPPRGGYFNENLHYTIFDVEWGQNIYRKAAWTDVNVGDFFANGVINAYGVGVADETAPNTFSPNQPILRGEFMKMMYRALSRIQPD
jgi:hypothetical protein